MTEFDRTGIDAVDAVRRLGRLIGYAGLTKDLEREWRELLERATMYDSLTNLMNRTYLDIRLNEEIARAKRHEHPLSIIMVDVDYFKLYNDTYGHPQGDVALQHIAKLLMLNRRPADVVARNGGDEFLLMFPDTNEEGSVRVAEGIAERVRSTPITTYVGREGARNNRYVEDRGFQNVTVSLGIATHLSKTASSDLLIRHADEALYRAKAKGGNTAVGYTQ